MDKDAEKKNHTYVKKMGHTSEFLFGIYWWILKKPQKIEFRKNEKKNFAEDIITLHMCTKNHNHMRYSSWGTGWSNLFCHFGPFFANYSPVPHPNNPENQSFEKIKKGSEDVIILNLRNRKHDKMMYAYSDMECSRHNFLSFYSVICSITPVLTPKI